MNRNGHIRQVKAADVVSRLDDGDRVEQLMRKFYPLVVEDAFKDASLAGVPVAFGLEMEEVQQVLGKLAKDIRAVAETTKDEVRRLVGLQAENGWTVEELAAQIMDLAETRSKTRALLIARTETGNGYNLGAVTAYRAGGVTHVDVLDGDDDAECAAANGSRWTLEEAEANPLGHPNCVRAFSPVVED